MRYLIDTQIFIWWMEKSKKIPKDFYEILNDPNNQITLSVASIWEIIIKKAKGKLKPPRDIKSGIKASRFTVLAIDATHVLGTEKLPQYHNDPFHRILISQSKTEKLVFITSDKTLQRYNTKFLKLKN